MDERLKQFAPPSFASILGMAMAPPGKSARILNTIDDCTYRICMLTYQGVVMQWYEHGCAGRMLRATAEEGCRRTGVVVQPLANLQTSKENVSVARNSILHVLSSLHPSR